MSNQGKGNKYSEGWLPIKNITNGMIVLDNNSKLIPISNLGWDEDYKSYVSSTNEYINYIYWFRLLKGINKIKVVGNCNFKIECEYPRKAGCL